MLKRVGQRSMGTCLHWCLLNRIGVPSTIFQTNDSGANLENKFSGWVTFPCLEGLLPPIIFSVEAMNPQRKRGH